MQITSVQRGTSKGQDGGGGLLGTYVGHQNTPGEVEVSERVRILSAWEFIEDNYMR